MILSHLPEIVEHLIMEYAPTMHAYYYGEEPMVQNGTVAAISIGTFFGGLAMFMMTFFILNGSWTEAYSYFWCNTEKTRAKCARVITYEDDTTNIVTYPDGTTVSDIDDKTYKMP